MERKILNLIKNHKCIIIFFISIIVPVLFLISNIDLSNIEVLKDDFLITFVGALLALGITLIALLYSILDSIKQILLNVENNQNIYKKIKLSIKELKDDILFIFYLLITLFLISFLKNVNIPNLNFGNIRITKTQFLQSLKFCILMLSLFSINDIIKALFKLLSITT